jgi:hypothetical protein
MKLFFTEDDHTLGLVEGEPAISITEANAKVAPLLEIIEAQDKDVKHFENENNILKQRIAAAEEALRYYLETRKLIDGLHSNNFKSDEVARAYFEKYGDKP